MLLIAAPGQGAQAPGFLSAWLELPGFADRLAAWSDLAGCDLIRCGTIASAEEIRDTAIAQPLLVAAALATAGELFGGIGQAGRLAGAAAGHSVGELAAGAIAGVIGPEDALRLVRVRGQAMGRAAAAEATGMTAVLGGDEAAVLAAIDELRAAASAMTVSDPYLALLSDRDGTVVRSGKDWIERIVTQVSAPVRWDKCMQSMTGLGVSAIIELPPAGTLTGLARRALPGVQLAALKTPDSLQAARRLIAEHGQADADSHAPEWRLLVAPLAGVFRAVSAGGPGVVVTSGA